MEPDYFNDQTDDTPVKSAADKNKPQPKLNLLDELKSKTDSINNKEIEKEKKTDTLFDLDSNMDDIFKVQKSKCLINFKNLFLK